MVGWALMKEPALRWRKEHFPGARSGRLGEPRFVGEQLDEGLKRALDGPGEGAVGPQRSRLHAEDPRLGVAVRFDPFGERTEGMDLGPQTLESRQDFLGLEDRHGAGASSEVHRFDEDADGVVTQPGVADADQADAAAQAGAKLVGEEIHGARVFRGGTRWCWENEGDCCGKREKRAPPFLASANRSVLRAFPAQGWWWRTRSSRKDDRALPEVEDLGSRERQE